MPVEIKELIIRAVAATDRERSETAPGLPMNEQDREMLIQECVRQVLRIIKKAKER